MTNRCIQKEKFNLSANYNSVYSGIEVNINACNHSNTDGMHTEMSEVHSGFSISVQIKYAILFHDPPKSILQYTSNEKLVCYYNVRVLRTMLGSGRGIL
jgi:hypothetical protein